MVKQHVVACDGPVERQRGLVVVPHSRSSVEVLLVICRDKAIHPASVILPCDHCRACDERRQNLAPHGKGLYAAAARSAYHHGLARICGQPIGVRVSAEVIIERVACLHEEDKVLNRRGSSPLLCLSRSGRRTDSQGTGHHGG